MHGVYAPDSAVVIAGSESSPGSHIRGKELVPCFDFTLITAIVCLNFFLLVIFVFFNFDSIHFSSMLSEYLSSRSKVMIILEFFKFSNFALFILFAAILIKILIGVLI